MYVNVQLLNMDTAITEQVTKNMDDGYTIFLNSRQSHEQLVYSYMHALNHIKNGDFDKEDVQQIEADAHKEE